MDKQDRCEVIEVDCGDKKVEITVYQFGMSVRQIGSLRDV